MQVSMRRTNKALWLHILGIWWGSAAAIDGIEVQSVEPSRASVGADPSLAQVCEAWQLTATQAEAFFRFARIVTAEESEILYDWLPCTISGIATWHGEVVRFEINAAARARLDRTNGRRILLGCPEPDCRPLVLMEGGLGGKD